MRITAGVRPADRDRLQEISELCYTGDQLLSKQSLEQTLDVSEVWVAYYEHGDWSPYPMLANYSSILGFIAVQENLRPYIWSVTVHPDFQGRGIGGNLLREVCQWAKAHNKTSIELHTGVSNPAQKLYFDYGFRVQLVIKNFYGTEDGMRMRRDV